jgi:hypothetical protein
MPTWEEIKLHLRERFQTAVENPSWLGLIWKFPDGAQGVLQKQRIEVIQALGQPHLLILSDVGPDDFLAPYDMLVHNNTLAIGAVAISQGFLIIRHVYALDGLTWPILDMALEYVAHEAARLRTRLGLTTAPSGPTVAIFDEE